MESEAAGAIDVDTAKALIQRLKTAYDKFLAPEGGIMHFEVVSDVHIASLDPNHKNTVQFQDMLSDTKRDWPETSLILNAGDITENGSESSVQGYFNVLEKNPEFTYMTALGNHDVRWRTGWDEIEERYLRLNAPYMGDTDGRVYWDKWVDGYHFIVLNTEWDLKDRAYLSPQQLAWLDEKLSENEEAGKPAFIAIHQPPYGTVHKSEVYPVGMQDHALKEVLRRHPQTIIFSGHVHNGLGKLGVYRTDYGTVVDLPSLRSNDEGDPQGQLGYHVTVYEDRVQVNLRSYRDDAWVSDYAYSIPLSDEGRPVGKVLDASFDDRTAVDVSGAGNDGAFAGDPAFVRSGNGSRGIVLDGADGSLRGVDFGAIEQLDLANSGMTALFEYRAEKDARGSVLNASQAADAAATGFDVSVKDGDAGNLVLTLQGQSDAMEIATKDAGLDDGNWHDVAVTIDVDGSAALFVDGEQAGSSALPKGWTAAASAKCEVELGEPEEGAESTSGVSVDSLGLYGSVLAPEEIASAWSPYRVAYGEDSVTLTWDEPTDDVVEPAYLTLDGKKGPSIASGATSATIDGLEPGVEHAVTLVNHEKSISGNYRDAYPFMVAVPAPLNRDAIDEAIEQAEKIEEGGWTPESYAALTVALDRATKLAGDETATQAELDAAATELDAAATELTAALEGLVPAVDKSKLQAACDEAAALDADDYKSAGWKTFAKALAGAEAVLADAKADQAAVDAAVKALADARAGLEEVEKISFIDVVAGTPHKGDIEWLAANGISTGWKNADGAFEFRPYATVRRADMAAFLYRLAGEPELDAEDVSFTDVDESTPHYEAILWLASEGISTGWKAADGTAEFRPYDQIARCDMAAFLYRMAGEPEVGIDEAFTDVDGSTPHREAVLWMAEAGVTTGWVGGDGAEFRPYGMIARCDMAAFIHRMDQRDLVALR